jgi:hypothetical protein
MARAYGSSAHLLMKRETVYGRAATGDYIRMPFNRCNLGSEQGLIDDPVLGQGRDPLAPLQDVINDEGDIVVPVDPRRPDRRALRRHDADRPGGRRQPRGSRDGAIIKCRHYSMHCGCWSKYGLSGSSVQMWTTLADPALQPATPRSERFTEGWASPFTGVRDQVQPRYYTGEPKNGHTASEKSRPA